MPVAVRELFVRNQNIHQYNTMERSNPRVNKWSNAISKRAFVYMGTHLWFKVAQNLQNILSIQKYLLKDTRNYCLKNSSIYYPEYEPARTCTITCSCYLVYSYFYFSTFIVLLIHNYTEYSILLALIFNTRVLV